LLYNQLSFYIFNGSFFAYNIMLLESKSKLLPQFVAHLKRHLVNKSELKLCASILEEILLSIHIDQKAVCILSVFLFIPLSLRCATWSLGIFQIHYQTLILFKFYRFFVYNIKSCNRFPSDCKMTIKLHLFHQLSRSSLAIALMNQAVKKGSSLSTLSHSE